MISLTSPVRTRAHGWPAGVKLAGLSVTTVMLFAMGNLGGQVAALLCCLALYVVPGRVFLRDGLRRLWVLWPFVLLVSLWHLVTGALVDGMLISLRLVTAVGLANLVTMTTQLSEMQALVLWLLRPLRRLGVKTGAIALAMALVVRFTPVLGQKGQMLAQSWRARSAGRPGWRLILPLVVLAIDDADHVADALKARGGVRD